MTLERRERGRGPNHRNGVSIQFLRETFRNLSPVESSSSRGRAAIKGGHNCFQVVETLGPRKILLETVFQLLASRLGEISRKRMCIQRLCIEIVVTRAIRVPGESLKFFETVRLFFVLPFFF